METRKRNPLHIFQNNGRKLANPDSKRKISHIWRFIFLLQISHSVNLSCSALPEPSILLHPNEQS